MSEYLQTAKQHIKIIVCDLDGTLLNKRKEISKATTKHLIKLQEAGYTLVLASGRFFYELEPYLQQLHMKEFHGYAVCANGLEVYDLSQGTKHRFDGLSKQEVDQILNVCRKRRINAYANDHQVYQAICNSWLYASVQVARFLLRPWKASSCYPIRLLYETDYQKRTTLPHWQSLDKICFCSTHQKLTSFKNEILSLYPQQFQFFFVNRSAIEIVKSNVSKKQALTYICEQKGYTLQHVLAFGDSGNDESLLQAAGIGITMKNGFYQTKKHARYLSHKTNEEEGVLDMLYKLSLIP